MNDDEKIVTFTPPPYTVDDFDETEMDDVADESADNSTDEEVITTFPEQLQKHRIKLIAGAVGFAFAAIGAWLYLKSPSALALLLGTIYFAYKAIALKRRYYAGYIYQVPAICTNVKPSRWRDSVTITFRTAPDDPDAEPEFFKFNNLPKKMEDSFVPGYPYMICFDIDEPNTIISYSDL